MNTLFGKILKKSRKEKGLSQKQLADQIFVNNSTVARWENGSRLPDAAMITRLSKTLDVDMATLLSAAAEIDTSPNIIIVDDNKFLIADSLSFLEEVVPNATITGFIWPKEALAYARLNRVSLAILDIELGTASGFDLCRELLAINPLTNVVFLTSYPDYALSAWETEACGFLVKPLTVDRIRATLSKLRYPIFIGTDA